MIINQMIDNDKDPALRKQVLKYRMFSKETTGRNRRKFVLNVVSITL